MPPLTMTMMKMTVTTKMRSEDIFSPFGLLGKSFPSFSYREGQEEMAKKVEKAFEEGRGCLIEAGTGIGKSFAYLVPAFLLTEDDPDSRVVVATSTITLQKQLFDKDIPFLAAMLGIENRSAILYGRSNYVCLRKVAELREKTSLLSLDESTPEHMLFKWCDRTESGSRLDIRDREMGRLASTVACDEKDCLRGHCPFFLDCFMYGARRRAQSARIVVTNHHMVLVDAQIRWENNEDFSESVILPPYTHLVLDEAHHIENEATELFSTRISRDRINEEIDFLSFKTKSLKDKSIIEYLSPCDTSSDRYFTKNFDGLSSRIHNLTSRAFSHFSKIISSYSTQRSVLLDEAFYNAARGEIMKTEMLCDEMKSFAHDLSSVYSSDNETYIPFIERVKMAGERLSLYAEALRSFIRFTSFDTLISYAELIDGEQYEIVLAPLLAGPLIKARLLDKLESYLFCSATLSIGGNFDFFKARIGISGDNTLEEGVYYSPFDYKHNLMYLVPQDGKAYSMNDTSYIEYVSTLTEKAILSSSGGALILFTSIDMMRKVYKRVNESIGEKMELLVQDNRTNRNELLSRFKKHKDSSLFAVSSFWEGVDAPGDTLRLLVIVKLPFDVPSEPVMKARSDYINRTENNSSFVRLTLPNAMIKMKQGVGRLIRSESDKGVVLILDGRISRKFYSSMLFSSIPEGYYPEDTMVDNIEGKIESFLF